MTKTKIVVIGGSAAGAKAAAKARRLDQEAEITIIQKDAELSMASCGYPYYLGNTFDKREMLLATPTGVVRDPLFFDKTKAITALTETEALAIDTEKKQVTVRKIPTGKQEEVAYHKLILAMGARPRMLAVPGSDFQGVTFFHTLKDTDTMQGMLNENAVKHAVIIGGGLIGVEACEALISRGVQVTLIEQEQHILSMLDSQLAMLVANHMKAKGVNILTGMKLEQFEGENGKLTGVQLISGEKISCEMAIVATGVVPNSELAATAGIQLGDLGGIKVDSFMQTSVEDIYAAGDCVETLNFITSSKVLMPMGDLANLQGRVAGENAVLGNSVTFVGTSGTAICKVFDFTAGVTGLTETAAANYFGAENIETVVNVSPDKPTFMGPKLLVSKMVVHKTSEKLIGYQSVGAGDVSRQIASAAMAIRGNLTVDDLGCADLPYAPPFSLAIDHFIASAHLVQNKLKNRFKTISAEELHERIQKNSLPLCIDCRGADEYEVLQLGIGERYIPLGKLRSVLDDLPEDKGTEIVCFCKISLRGYEAALVLEANGWHNVRVLEGGIMGWPYSRAI